ncbi:MAG: class I SAM-dependent methyltransferase [Rhodospirillaceae bacterium]
MTAVLYDTIGDKYRTHRAADARIAAALIELMDVAAGSAICDVGAGSGNYANAVAAAGFRVLALEPSQVMRAQADACERITWIGGLAEAMPLRDQCVEAAMCVLAVHHFRSLAATLREMDRVARGTIVFFTCDPRGSEPFWFHDYFPEIIADGLRIFPRTEEFVAEAEAATGRRGEVRAFPLPRDLRDQFMSAHWHTPEAYFDASLRANHSGFAKADPVHVERGLAKLRADLSSGAWDRRHGHLRVRERFDAGYRFLTFRR